MGKQEEIKFFNDQAKVWDNKITQEHIKVAKDFISEYNIGANNAVLDVGAGTGIIYTIIDNKNLTDYVGIDIAENMVKEFRKKHPEADIRCDDFELECQLEKAFDFVIIFDGIPHFRNLSKLFENAYNNLNKNGKFIIVHSKTRKEFKANQEKNGYNSEKSLIPTDAELIYHSKEKSFTNIIVEDDRYFKFVCEKN
ncbi:class I SAM-dependent DNA methyltransferase [Natranaerobius thermophilus]|uniref:Methyltransferase type 11 n=1 Tax=Natranaerobius thermophilus (strain ATCC BAA-1301 / DSM 18059 / JW/NM-WN-LF) TaxID=457570 RepID=B2A103_NATTJ|nr:class I SAM-dependent methyltransferase [Natranaerobius thermophilus]ACB84626.1 Methyltransferase type 11 [Natranaerobius thermophilus JW/NM-WN-LF]